MKSEFIEVTKTRQTETQSPIQRAILVGIQLPKVTELEVKSSVAELARLVTTLGYKVVGELYQKRKSDRDATVLGDGKLNELAQITGGTGTVTPTFIKKKHRASLKFEKNQNAVEDADLSEDENDFSIDEENEATENVELLKADIVVFDCDLSPSQLRNVESATGATVLDRTGVIIEIFSRHAKTRTAKAQVEIARLSYVAPRLRETGGGEDRQGGGVGGKGAGESSIELDRRKIRDRIKELKDELVTLGNEQNIRRQKRNQEVTVALVGYTNAGKSSLMRALTGSEVLVADKLFATLDTTVRILYPESLPKILISDTVGFIKKLPHDLVASFKSTLDEALNASLLLFVVDSSDETFESQLAVTTEVLSEVSAVDIPSLLIMNKSDRLSEARSLELKMKFPDAIFLSAQRPSDVAMLRQRLIDHFSVGMVEIDILIPYQTKGAIGDLRSFARVISETYNNEGTLFRVCGFEAELEKFKSRYQL
ncbi:MAG: GTPase HflX [Pseudobdellovibrionaceae bacterium]